MISRGRILGVILAGGQSSRFGDGDKGLADLGGRPVLAYIIDALRPQVEALVLNVNGDAARFAALELPTMSDGEFAGRGPLSGVLAALRFAADEGFEAVATVSSDVPFLPPDLVTRLYEARGDHLAIAMSQGRRHPTIALWPVDLASAVAEALASDQRGVDRLTKSLNAVAIDFPMRDIGGLSVDTFLNLNTPQDFAAARSLIQTRDQTCPK